MPVPYSLPSVEVYTRTPSHNHPSSDLGAQITSLRSHNLVVPRPKQHAFGCEWWWRLVSPSTGGDWWVTCHNVIGVSPLLPPPFTYRGSVLLGRQLRALCLGTELEKRKKEKVRLSLSVSLVKGDRGGTRWRGLQGASHFVHVCRKGCYVCENVMEGGVGAMFGGNFWGVLWGVLQVWWTFVDIVWESFHVGWWLCSSNLF